MPQERETNYHAILIGINSADSEDGPGLKGCVPDVQEIRKQLENSSIPGRLAIHSFTSSPGLLLGTPMEPHEQWPTYENINSCISTVTKESGKGDHVYIHFSGHSTVIPPNSEQTYSNKETGDLALVVLEGSSGTDECYFHGSDLALHLNNMVKRGIGVTIVLDCCYSGSTLRKSDQVVRYVPYRSELDKRPPQTLKQSPTSFSGLRGGRQTSLVPAWLADPEGYAILTSSDATEKAYGIKLRDGSRHGTLSYFLLEVFDELGGIGGKMHQLAESIRVRIKDHRRNHTTRTQSPVLFGNKTQFFFGLAAPGYTPEIPITRIIGRGDVFRLHAGAAQGVTKGDKFALQPVHASPVPISVTAEAIAVRGITSDIQIVHDSANSNVPVAVETGWLATVLTRLSLRQFPLQLSVRSEFLGLWQEALRARVSITEYPPQSHQPSCVSGWSFGVLQKEDTRYEICDEHQNPIVTDLDIGGGAERVIEQILSLIHHLISFKLVLSLSSFAVEPDEQGFNQSYSAAVIHDRKGTSYNPGCGKTGNLQEVCLHPECQIILSPRDKVKLVVKNLAPRNGPRLFLHLYALGSDWEVADMTRSSREVIPPQGSSAGDPDDGVSHKTSGIFQRKLMFSLEEGQETCQDVVKVFLTRQPTSFAMLELPTLRGRLSSDAQVDIWGNSTRAASSLRFNDSEDWAALTFRVRVIK